MTRDLCLYVSSSLKFSFVTKFWRITEGEWIRTEKVVTLSGGSVTVLSSESTMETTNDVGPSKHAFLLPHELSHNSFAILPVTLRLVFHRLLLSSLTSMQLIAPRASQVHACGKRSHLGFFFQLQYR